MAAAPAPAEGVPGLPAGGLDGPPNGGPAVSGDRPDRPPLPNDGPPPDRDDRPPRPRPPGDGRDGPTQPDGGGAPVAQEGLIEYLLAGHGSETWIVATVSARTAAPIILETGEAVMAMGGFGGGDPTPTADELAAYIESGELRFVLLTPGNRNTESWIRVVKDHCEVVDAGEYGGAGAAVLSDCSG